MTKGHGWFAPRLIFPRNFLSFFLFVLSRYIFILCLFFSRFFFLLASSLRFGFLGSLFHFLADILAHYFLVLRRIFLLFRFLKRCFFVMLTIVFCFLLIKG